MRQHWQKSQHPGGYRVRTGSRVWLDLFQKRGNLTRNDLKMIGERARNRRGSIQVLNNRRVEAGCEKLI